MRPGTAGRAFGIEIHSEPRPSRRGVRADGVPATILRLVSDAQIDAAWRVGCREEALELVRRPDGELTLAIDRREGAGFRFVAPGYGSYLVAPQGGRVLCATHGLETWRMERFLSARVLPLAATLLGIEILHAAAVVVDGLALAFVGASQSGKSSLALQLALGGAALLTDDLLAIEVRGDEAIAHPGREIVGIRHGERETLSAEELDALGELIDGGDKLLARMEVAPGPARLARLYFLRRYAPDGDGPPIAAVPAPDPRHLLAAGFFNRHVRDPDRLRRQLAACAAIAASATIFDVRVDAYPSARALARAIEQHASDRLS